MDKKFQTQNHALGTRGAGGLADKKFQTLVARNVGRGESGGVDKKFQTQDHALGTQGAGGLADKMLQTQFARIVAREEGAGQKVPNPAGTTFQTQCDGFDTRGSGQNVRNTVWHSPREKFDFLFGSFWRALRASVLVEKFPNKIRIAVARALSQLAA